MTTFYYTHPSGLHHDTGAGHPERADRLKVVQETLSGEDFTELSAQGVPAATMEQIARVHPESYIQGISAVAPHHEIIRLDADTVMSPGTLEAALRAAGACVAAVDAVATGRADNAFVAMRPPGHHAEPSRPMGFCLFNNVAIGALHARVAHGFERVAVIDFDVHHGNGTEAAFREDPNLFYGSTHQSPLYPGTGRPDETGVANNICNATLPPEADGVAFRKAMTEVVLPKLDAFKPDFLLISAGFDAHEKDLLAQLSLNESDFAWATEQLVNLAKVHCAGRIVSTLEGGYDLDGLAKSTAAHVAVLMAA